MRYLIARSILIKRHGCRREKKLAGTRKQKGKGFAYLLIEALRISRRNVFVEARELKTGFRRC